MTTIQVENKIIKNPPVWPVRLEFGKWYLTEDKKTQEEELITLNCINSKTILIIGENGKMLIAILDSFRIANAFIKEIKNLTITVEG